MSTPPTRPPTIAAVSDENFAIEPICVWLKPRSTIERRLQGDRHIVAELVQEHECQHEHRCGHAPARKEFAEGFDDRFRAASSARAVRPTASSIASVRPMPGNHESGNKDEHGGPGQVVGKDERKRTRDQAGETVGLDVDRVAKPQFAVRQQFAPVRVEHDVLARAEEGYRAGQERDARRSMLGIEEAERRRSTARPLAA